MIIYDDINQIELSNIAVAIGMFDGIHRGHLEIINKLKTMGLKSCIFSFDITNSIKLIQKKNKIIANKKKIEIFNNLDIDYYICPLFSKVQGILANDFVKDLLIDKLDSKIVICGQDFKFGWNRLGNIKLLKNWFDQYNRELYVVETQFVDYEKISSSNIRMHIKNGEIKRANLLLGRNFSLDFKVSDYCNGFICQSIENNFVCPPNGQYLSIIKKSQEKIKTTTFICDMLQQKVARTYYKGDIADNISIELIDKI